MTSPEPLTQTQNNFTELLLDTLYQICTNGYALLSKRAARVPDKIIFKTAFPPEPLVQIQNILKAIKTLRYKCYISYKNQLDTPCLHTNKRP